MKAQFRNKGFTLVELLIAMTILIALITSASWSHRFFVQQWQRLSLVDDDLTRKSLFFQALSQVFMSTLSVSQTAGPNQVGFVWLGNRSQFAGVTSSPIFNNEGDSIYRLSFVNNDLGCVLKYEEQPLQIELADLNLLTQTNLSEQLVLQIDSGCKNFIYLGWDRPISGDNNETGIAYVRLKSDAKWQQSYDGVENQSIPLGVKLQLVDQGSLTFRFSNYLANALVASEANND